MLRIDAVLLDLARALAPVIGELERHDADLARQCRRALGSAPRNVAEGSHSRGKNRTARYRDALGSLREVLACLEVAEALGYTHEADGALGALRSRARDAGAARRAVGARRGGGRRHEAAPPRMAARGGRARSRPVQGAASPSPFVARAASTSRLEGRSGSSRTRVGTRRGAR
jgi:four helix bundle protein